MKKIMTGARVMSVMLAGGALAEGMNPGTYESTFRGYNADIRVKVAVCADRIESVEVAEQAESQNIGAKACEILPERIVNAQSIGVDSVSGATITSAAIKAAVKDAIKTAGGVVEAYNTDATSQKTGDQTYDCDVVVIGAGGGGMAAAVRAQQLQRILHHRAIHQPHHRLRAIAGQRTQARAFAARHNDRLHE